LSPFHCGTTVRDFREEDLLSEFNEIPGQDWSGATWPPNIVHRDIWDLVGGYSIEYFPGLYSDPDFSMKLFVAGVRYYKGVNASRVYHFGSKSTKRIKMNHGSKQFLNKWGITSASFSKFYLRRGQEFKGAISVDYAEASIKKAMLKSKLKKILWSFSRISRNYGPGSQ
jgi:GT2 family glycosyltransferase